ncbi:MAG: hypothetical protein WA399_08150 [Acidobacteriaceae bacterium]
MNSSNPNELRDFLLDRLPPERAEAIEERMFLDEAYFSDLQDAEDELIEEYVTEEMDPEEARLFAARVERDPELQKRVALRRVLIRTLQQGPAVPAADAASAPRGRRGLWGRFLVPGFALAILVVFFLSYRAEHRNSLPSQATGTPPASLTQEQTGSRQEAMSSAAAVLFLPAQVARGVSPRSSVLHTGNAGLVRLELETPSAEGHWDVRITNGGTVFSAGGLSPRQAGVVSYVVAEVRASQLPPKVYRVTLSPEASSSGAVSTSWDLEVVK